MESIDARVFFDEFAKAMQTIGKMYHTHMDSLNSEDKRLYQNVPHTIRTNNSTVEAAVISKLAALDKAQKGLSAYLPIIYEGINLICTVSAYMGSAYADVLTLRYASGFSIRTISSFLCIGIATTKRRLDVALDWLDSMPESYLKNFVGLAEK